MKSVVVMIAFGLLASVAVAGLSGTYTIKPAGGGDFQSIYEASNALDSVGMSGNCVFEVYGDSQDGNCYLNQTASSDSWTTTFRPGPGAHPVFFEGSFDASGYDNVKIESLTFAFVRITASSCSGWRISGCSITGNSDGGIEFENSTGDTVDGNTLDSWSSGAARYSPIHLNGGSDNLLFNNFVNSESTNVTELVWIDHTRNARCLFNTLRMSVFEVGSGCCIWVSGEHPQSAPCEIRNNIFVLARPADSLSGNACVSLPDSGVDSIVLDYNCYFVESLGVIGERPSHPNLYNWAEWRGFGFEAHGINRDPTLVSATDLHLRQGSPCNTRATPIAGINSDIDGDPRDPTHPDMGADEITGGAVGEAPSAEVQTAKRLPTVVRGVLSLPEAPSRKPQAASLLDATGRRVMELHSGANDVRALAPGVYFVQGTCAKTLCKVVLTK